MSSRYTEPATKSDLDLLESSIRLEITKQLNSLMMGGFLAVIYIAFWVMIIVALATESNGKG